MLINIMLVPRQIVNQLALYNTTIISKKLAQQVPVHIAHVFHLATRGPCSFSTASVGSTVFSSPCCCC
jgi:hypothetical protein